MATNDANLPPVEQEPKPPAERTNFRALMLANPNYFGTFPDLGGKVVQSIQSDTTYEEIGCLGLNQGQGFFPQSRLEAVVHIKQSSGYGTGPCGAGTLEYVRFYVQDPSGWHDLGSSAVHVYDLPGSPHPVSYAVSIAFTEARKFCSAENIVNVRAILSWNLDPPAGNPSFIPVWGSVANARVQVAPLSLLDVSISDLVKAGELTFKGSALDAIDVTEKLPVKEPQPLSYLQLKQLYAAKPDAAEAVPPHRFGFVEAQKVLEAPLGKAIPAKPANQAPGFAAKFGQISASAELGNILAGLAATQGNTEFEQLTCAGYNPQTRELEAVIAVKKNSGYSGSLCSPGSTEYVAFYAFVGGIWQSLGQTQVKVHDLAAVTPGNPVAYAVYRISNLPEFACEDLKAIPLRAILSWQTAPTGPGFIPVWGNVVNTFVQPLIGTAGPDAHVRLMRIGRVTISGINDVTGLANPTGIAGDCNNADQSPFGGETVVEGDFSPKIDVFNHINGHILPGAKPILYQVFVTRTDVVGTPFQLVNDFGIGVFPEAATLPVTITQTAVLPGAFVVGALPGSKFYQYYESAGQAVNPRTLAVFEAGGFTEGNYRIDVHGYRFDGLNYVPMAVQSKTIHVYNGYPHVELGTPVQRPEVSLTFTNIGDCGTTPVGTILKGNYSVIDRFFGSVSVRLVPITISGVPQPAPTVSLSTANTPDPGVVVFDGTNTTGTSGEFTLDSNDMTPCGYNIRLVAYDRALVSSSCSGHATEQDIGFCLSPAKK